MPSWNKVRTAPDSPATVRVNSLSDVMPSSVIFPVSWTTDSITGFAGATVSTTADHVRWQTRCPPSVTAQAVLTVIRVSVVTGMYRRALAGGRARDIGTAVGKGRCAASPVTLRVNVLSRNAVVRDVGVGAGESRQRVRDNGIEREAVPSLSVLPAGSVATELTTTPLA